MLRSLMPKDPNKPFFGLMLEVELCSAWLGWGLDHNTAVTEETYIEIYIFLLLTKLALSPNEHFKFKLVACRLADFKLQITMVM